MPGFALVREPLGRARRSGTVVAVAGLAQAAPPAATPTPGRSRSSGVLEHSVERRPLPLYLRVEDRNSMAHSVEARLPFLDYRLVSLAFSLPGEWKLRGGWNKYLVREAMKGVIAEPVRTRRDKMGFPTPSKDWWARRLVRADDGSARQPRAARERRVRRRDGRARSLQRHVRGRSTFAAELFRLAEFATWLDVKGHVATPDAASDERSDARALAAKRRRASRGAIRGRPSCLR